MHETIYTADSIVDEGLYCCTDCGLKIYRKSHHILPLCPRCNNHEYTKEKG